MRDREHEVFISYSSKNKNIADAIVADLEQNSIRCWYAPRDIYPGEDWAGAIKNAIESTKIFILVFTDESNRSHQVTNEVTLAVNNGKIIIPFRLSGADMNDTLQYYLSSVHWLDAVSQPLHKNIEVLRRQIAALLDITVTTEVKTAAAAPAAQTKSKTGIVIGILAAALAVCVGIFVLTSRPKQSADAGQAAAVPAAETGKAQPEAETEETEPEAVKEAEAQAETEPEAAEPEAEAADLQQSETEPAAEEDLLVMIPESAIRYKGHHYYIYNDIDTNWDEAASNCRDRGGYLAVINDEEENETVYKYMIAMGYEQVFFGLTFSPGKDDWVYLDGDTSDYRDWGYNSEGVKEPNNAEGWEYHAQFDANMQDGHWNDAKYGANIYAAGKALQGPLRLYL
jgi:hypothetical protein